MTREARIAKDLGFGLERAGRSGTVEDGWIVKFSNGSHSGASTTEVLLWHILMNLEALTER